jgi:hypothetical protein
MLSCADALEGFYGWGEVKSSYWLFMRLDPKIKALAVKAAKRQHRTLTNYVCYLILQDSKQGGQNSTPPK